MKIVNAYITLALLDETGVGRGRVEVQADRTTRAPFERKRMGEKSPTCLSSHRSFPILFWLLWYWCAVPEQKKKSIACCCFPPCNSGRGKKSLPSEQAVYCFCVHTFQSVHDWDNPVFLSSGRTACYFCMAHVCSREMWCGKSF